MTPEEFCICVGVERAALQFWLDEGWLVPQGNELTLSEMDLARGRLVRHLSSEIGVNPEGIGIILDLIDQVHGLRSALRQALRAPAA